MIEETLSPNIKNNCSNFGKYVVIENPNKL